MRSIRFKKMDLYGQVVLLIASLILLPIEMGYGACVFLFGLGSWQLISSIVVRATCEETTRYRAIYERVTWWLIIAIPLSLVIRSMVIVSLMVAFFYGIIAGFYYLILTARELSSMKQTYNHE